MAEIHFNPALLQGSGTQRVLKELISEALVRLDRDGQVSFWNQAATELLGWTAEEVVGRTLPCLPDEEAVAFADFLRFVSAEREPTSQSFRMRMSSGPVIPVVIRGMADQPSSLQADIWLTLHRSSKQITSSSPSHVESSSFWSKPSDWQRIQAQMLDGLWEWDVLNDRLHVDDRYLQIRGLTRDGFDGSAEQCIKSILPEDLNLVCQGIEQFSDPNRGESDTEYRIRKPSGEIRWIHCRAVTTDWNSAHQATRVIGIHRDITEQKQREETLSQREALLSSVLESLDDLVLVVDRDGRIIRELCSPHSRWAGTIPLTESAKTLTEIGFSKSVELELCAALRCLEVGIPAQPLQYELRSETTSEWFQATLTRRQSPSGEFLGATVLLHDITPLKEAHREAIRQGLSRRRLLDSIRSEIWYLDVDGKIVDLNLSAEKNCGKHRSEVDRQPFVTVLGTVYGCEIEGLELAIQSVVVSGEPQWDQIFEVHGDRQQSQTFQYDVVPLLDQEQTVFGVMICLRETTVQTRIEASLRESEERFRQLADSVPFLIWMCDASGANTYVNAAYREFTQCTQEELRDRQWAEFLHPEDRATAIEDLTRAVRERIPFTHEIRFRSMSGRYHWMHSRGVPQFHPDGKFAGIIGSSIDITQRKVTERALQRSEQLYRQLIESSGDAIITMYPDGRIDFVNTVFESLLGYSQIELRQLRVPYRVLVASEHELTRWRYHNSFLHTGRFPEELLTLNLVHRDGHFIPTECRFTNIVNPESDGKTSRLLIHIRDISERLLLEDKLRRSDKMEAIGQLAGGLAHDFNNLLTVINGQSELLLKHQPLTDDARDSVEQIAGSGSRAAELTRQLLAFGRQQPQDLQVLNLNELIRNLSKLISSLVGDEISVQWDLTADLYSQHTDRSQMERVLLNLIVNARDALPQGGQITIRTRNMVGINHGSADSVEDHPGPRVELTISDNGEGMSTAIQSHLFEPFFTTKAPGRGTVLGLPTVYGIVRQNRGTISIDSKPEQGTTVQLTFPALAPVVPVPISNITDPNSSADSGHETILVVEDNDGVRNLIRTILQNHGYSVVLARDGRDGVEVSRHFHGEIQLVISDIVMPNLNGCEMVQMIVQERPQVDVLMMSGYADDEIQEYQEYLAAHPFLHKPFTSTGLLTKIREILDVRRTASASK